jgi:glyceraldehyde-3-phosphate dehydrogenase/erythrose-4-phosphate dehydrogenase
VRVPVPAGSLVDVTFVASRPTTVEEVNGALMAAAKTDRTAPSIFFSSLSAGIATVSEFFGVGQVPTIWVTALFSLLTDDSLIYNFLLWTQSVYP